MKKKYTNISTNWAASITIIAMIFFLSMVQFFPHPCPDMLQCQLVCMKFTRFILEYDVPVVPTNLVAITQDSSHGCGEKFQVGCDRVSVDNFSL